MTSNTMQNGPSDHRTVNARLNYLSDDELSPVYYAHPEQFDDPKPMPAAIKQFVNIHDMRPQIETLSLDKEGFVIVEQRSAVKDFFDDDEVKRIYYPEVERLVKQATGAGKVMVFDHVVRSGADDGDSSRPAQKPVRFVHNDYTEKSGPQRVRDLLGEECAERLLEHPFAIINVWRPFQWRAQDKPLAVCDAQSMEAGDFVNTDLVYTDRIGEIYSVKYNPNHRWFYVSQMAPDEVMLLKCYDSEHDGRARFTAHSAFVHPDFENCPNPRLSIEIRTLAFFAPAEALA